MSNLLREISRAQVRAGEDAVIRHLEAQGLINKPAYTPPVVAELEATWSISLDTTCPGCNEDVDLLATSDFWEDTKVEPIENCTNRSNNLSVTCPKCSHEFEVRCVY